MEVLGK